MSGLAILDIARDGVFTFLKLSQSTCGGEPRRCTSSTTGLGSRSDAVPLSLPASTRTASIAAVDDNRHAGVAS